MTYASWADFLRAEKELPYFQGIIHKVQEDAKKHAVYPKQPDLFGAFQHCPLNKARVVILGQDPYINEGQAHGLSFSVPPGVPQPPSLRNIFKELQSDLGIEAPKSGCLIEWSRRGVLLLNSILTVRQGESGSHSSFGWQELTDKAISLLNDKGKTIFILWGRDAKKKLPLITNDSNLILQGAHPSPLAAHNGFFGGRYFSRCNQFLLDNGQEPIEWSLKG